MSQKIKLHNSVSRRQFLRLTAISSGAALLAACGANGSGSNAAESSGAATVAPRATATPSPESEAKVMVEDVLDFVLESDEWAGQYGSVTFRLQEGRHNDNPVYFIRTDSSDQSFAQEVGLVHVPLLANGKEVAESIYLFSDGRPPILSSTPDDGETFTSLFQVKNVSVSDDSLVLESAEAVEAAAADGRATLEESAVFVNYPLVKWAGGELAVDDEKKETLGKGQLMESIDTGNMTVTFKLHQCFPGSRYILTDTSLPGMAPMMSVPPSAPNQKLLDLAATDEIWIFVNGIEGSGVMGFQPAIFDNEAGQPAWSPFWDHRALKWTDGTEPHVLRSSTEIREAIDAGELEEFLGVPDTHPNGFVVNCPAPILAPNTFGI
ncbi:MAG: hypothetical protein GY796_14415 [Chloroflexi bacterium]|nr:hypothetical protein [Chloroflexota bacterium]